MTRYKAVVPPTRMTAKSGRAVVLAYVQPIVGKQYPAHGSKDEQRRAKALAK